MTTIKVERERRGWTQLDLAAKAGTGYSTVWRAENGVAISALKANKIMSALEVRRADLTDLKIIGEKQATQE